MTDERAARDDPEILQEYVRDNINCPECRRMAMTEREMVEHRVEKHSEATIFSDLFPEYYVCCEEYEGDELIDMVACYLKVVSEAGPYYTVTSESDVVEESNAYELLRHDWERVDRDETPFPKFEA